MTITETANWVDLHFGFEILGPDRVTQRGGKDRHAMYLQYPHPSAYIGS